MDLFLSECWREFEPFHAGHHIDANGFAAHFENLETVIQKVLRSDSRAACPKALENADHAGGILRCRMNPDIKIARVAWIAMPCDRVAATDEVFNFFGVQ